MLFLKTKYQVVFTDFTIKSKQFKVFNQKYKIIILHSVD